LLGEAASVRVLAPLTTSAATRNNPPGSVEESASAKHFDLDALAVSKETVKGGEKLAWYVSISSICHSD